MVRHSVEDVAELQPCQYILRVSWVEVSEAMLDVDPKYISFVMLLELLLCSINLPSEPYTMKDFNWFSDLGEDWENNK